MQLLWVRNKIRPYAFDERHPYYKTILQIFIPTDVGNTKLPRFRTSATTVHPHERGEYVMYDDLNRRDDGSSPRAWGIHRSARHSCRGQRFIPTGVGNTQRIICPTCRTTVHPHGRGEYCQSARSRQGCYGSSPRAWGILVFSMPVFLLLRFIPTGVGNTSEYHKNQ